MKHETKVIMRRGLYVWTCGCGRDSRRGYGFAGHAESYGKHHADTKNRVRKAS